MPADAPQDSASLPGSAPGTDAALPDIPAADTVPSLADIGLDQFAPYLLNRISARWNNDLSELLREHDLTTVKMRTLASLSTRQGLTINELAIYSVTEQSTMSRTLDTMEEQGLIRREPRASDLRAREVYLTEKGRQAFARFWPTMYREHCRLFAGLDTDEYRAFVGTLHRILANVRKSAL